MRGSSEEVSLTAWHAGSLPARPCSRCVPQVNGLLNGYTATNLTLPLTAVGSGRYQGQLNVGTEFPDLTYATNASIAFCQANTANIKASCSSQGVCCPKVLPPAVAPQTHVRASSHQPAASSQHPAASRSPDACQATQELTALSRAGASFSDSSTLLKACSQFLTNGEVSNSNDDPQQVAVACSVAAVQVGLRQLQLCARSQALVVLGWPLCVLVKPGQHWCLVPALQVSMQARAWQ